MSTSSGISIKELSISSTRLLKESVYLNVSKPLSKITKFLRAVVRALYFIVDNEDQSIEMIMKYAQNEDKSHQIYMLRSEIKDAWSTITKENGLGWMSDNQWNSFYKYLNEWGALGKDIDINKVYTTSILEEVYSDSSNRLDLKR